MTPQPLPPAPPPGPQGPAPAHDWARVYLALQTAPTLYACTQAQARAQAGRVSITWDDALNSDENHRAAAQALADKFKWTGQLVTGFDHNQDGVHVFLPRA